MAKVYDVRVRVQDVMMIAIVIIMMMGLQGSGGVAIKPCNLVLLIGADLVHYMGLHVIVIHIDCNAIELVPQALVVMQEVGNLLLQLHILIHEHRVHRGQLPVQALQPRRLLPLLLAAPAYSYILKKVKVSQGMGSGLWGGESMP